jgi:phosphatidylinositol 3-kinase
MFLVVSFDPFCLLQCRITDEMIKGFGGHESDNFSKFLSFVGAAFLTLRRHNNLHALLSHVFNMVHANMGDLSINQPPEEAILAMRGRFRLDLNDDDALAYIENVVEKSIMSKMWRAVDVMHSLGKHF